MGTVNKDGLVRAIAERTGQQLAATQAMLDAFMYEVKTLSAGGHTIRLVGFGAFSVKARPARTGRNPATGEAVEIPETRRLHFKAPKVS